MNKTPELLPCPFCRGEAKIKRVTGSINYRYVKCSSCGARTKDWFGVDVAVTNWNTRVYPQKVIEDYFRKSLSVNCKCGTPIIADKKICPKCGQNWSDYE